MRSRASGLALVAVIGLTACSATPAAKPGVTLPTPAGGSSSSSTSISTTPVVKPTTAPADDATAIAKKIKGQVASVVKVVTITENNDPNNKIGRPGGYTSAAVIYEKSVKCSGGLGADCGATIEVWSSAADAKARAAYIQKAMKDMPILGNEYDYIRDGSLLRVAGDVKPSLAKRYNAAFGGVLFQ